ncbi:MAG: polysaccharide lyase 6 family protein [Calditrichaeota bacterium]|nr:polysaccharide lyase 6 family protein [Calditrichota bacterium]
MRTPAEIALALPFLLPGDTLTMADGVWQDADIRFRASANVIDSILLRAETSGQVILTGNSRLRLYGSYLIVKGLYFKNGSGINGEVVAFRESATQIARHSRLTECAFESINSPLPGSASWVTLYGSHNRIDHCYFFNKTTAGPTLTVVPDGQPNEHRIDHNYFAFRPPLGSNGGETIQIGTSEWSMYYSHTLVEHNYFERCNGEAEIISSKASANIIRYNTFRECEGALSLRHGNFCEVYGNFFFGNFQPLTGGVRIVGEDHRVYNNYFQDLAGIEIYSPLSLMNGIPNSPLNGYFQVKRAQVLFNTLVNCYNPVVIGLGRNTDRTLPPLDCAIAGNVIFTADSDWIIAEVDTPHNMLYQGNIMFGSPLGIPPRPGISRVDPLLHRAADSLWRPMPASPVIGAGQGNYPFVNDDVDGHMRNLPKDSGADQVSPAPVLRRPLTPLDVGPPWFPPAQYAPQDHPRPPLRSLLLHTAPNPFNPATTISFTLPHSARVRLEIFAISGARVEVLIDQHLPPGAYHIRWRPQRCASGLFFCRLQANSAAAVRKLIHLK